MQTHKKSVETQIRVSEEEWPEKGYFMTQPGLGLGADLSPRGHSCGALSPLVK